MSDSSENDKEENRTETTEKNVNDEVASSCVDEDSSIHLEPIVQETKESNDVTIHDPDVGLNPSSSLIHHETPSPTTAIAMDDGDETNTRRPLDTTHRKVVVHNVNKHMRPKEVENMINSWKPTLLQANIHIEKFKKPQANYLNITLANESMIPEFLDIINSGTFTNKKGGKLFASKAQDRQYRDGDGSGSSRKHQRDDDDHKEKDEGTSSNNKKAKSEESLIKTDDQVRDATAPLWRLTYDQQLEKKSKRMIHKCLLSIMTEIKGKFKKHPKDRNPTDEEVYEWLRKGNKIILEPILGAPIHTKYRNKCEFTFVSISLYIMSQYIYINIDFLGWKLSFDKSNKLIEYLQNEYTFDTKQNRDIYIH